MLRMFAALCLTLVITPAYADATQAAKQDTPAGPQVSIDPARAVILVPGPAAPDATKAQRWHADQYRDAAEELQRHLSRVTGVLIPIASGDATPPVHEGYTFHIGQASPGTDADPDEQAARWDITPKAGYFYGGQGLGSLTTHHAIYDFLEHQLGITWVAPGEAGIVFTRQPELSLAIGSRTWTPPLMFRKIRQAHRHRAHEMDVPERFKPFPEFWPSREHVNQLADDDMRWQQRMRMGGRRPGGGHAFAHWWEKYGASHPGYFALNKFGKREPVKLAKGPEKTRQFVKICPSNPAVVDRIVEDWLPRQDLIKYVNVGVNDGAENFCACADCRALDVRRPGENPDALAPGRYHYPDGRYVHLTDRYVHLANAAARRVRQHRPDAHVVMYAYLTTLHPPRALKLEPNVVVQIVPYVIPLDEQVARELINGWYEAGATKIAFRPNYHFKYHTMPLPLGIEREMYNVFQVAYRNGCISADYDSLQGHWGLTGMADYILARSIAEPGRGFEHWEAQYLTAFGDAAPDIGDYFRYWRQTVWEGRLKPNLDHLTTLGRYGNFARGLGWSIRANYTGRYQPEHGDAYYQPSDFDQTDAILQRAASRDLTPQQAARVEQLALINRHSRLVHAAMNNPGNEGDRAAMDLLAFRRAHHEAMDLSWTGIFYVEDTWGDLCRQYLAQRLEAYPLPWIETPFKWRFQIDENNVGLENNWHRKTWSATSDWKPIRVNVPWSNTYESPHVKLKEKLKSYDGVGWYTFRVETPHELKGREVLLHFGGVADACWVYVNGKAAGERVVDSTDHANEPFQVRIDPRIDWSAAHQVVTVRVRDLGGPGGVHKPTWVVSR